MKTIQDVEQVADALGQAIRGFDAQDQKAQADNAAASAADAVAANSDHQRDLAKQAMIEAHQQFDAVLDSFLNPTPTPTPSPSPSPAG